MAEKRAPVAPAEQPSQCPDDVWEPLPVHIQSRAPGTIAELWAQWAELQWALHWLDAILFNPKVPSGHTVTRVTAVRGKGDEPNVLAIADGEKGSKQFAQFHRGSDTFKALAMISWKICEGRGEWKVRERRQTQDDAAGDSPFTSGAF